jgi:hypothetical protein
MPNDWIANTLTTVAEREHWGYRRGEPPAAEPTALCALALVGHQRFDPAVGPLEELTKLQAADGAVGVHPGEANPHWGTAYAVLAWQAALRAFPPKHPTRERYTAAVAAACQFLLAMKGKTLEPSRNREVSHNTMLVGWPWIEGTHSWMEPTALAYLALKAAGERTHPRSVEAVALMVDRLLPDGGCNHGNTFVLGQVLRPHIQPSGLVMLALPYEAEGEPRIDKTLNYLEQVVDETTTAASLAYALHGLAAHGRKHPRADELLAGAMTKPTLDLGAYGTRRPLLALAALGAQSPLVELSRQGAPS